ncbi:MAG: flagellar hook-basal body complex protein FliE [Myxococcota bacterium]
MVHGVGGGFGIAGVGGVGGIGAVEGTRKGGAGGFAEALSDAVRSVEGAQLGADEKLRGVTTGQSVDIHGTMIALEEANISLRMMGSVRDKAVEGWQAIWNMPI